jgi:asparagine synthase (glutamine-hydrolysing)
MSRLLVGMSRRGRHSYRSDAVRKLAAICAEPRSLPHPYFFTRLLFTPQQVERLSSSRLLAARRARDSERLPLPWRAWLELAARQAEGLGGDAAVSWLELRTYTADTLLRDTDAMSMNHSLEVRVPLLDHPLVECVAALPDAAKRGRGPSKALLVEALGDLLPEDVVHQPKRTFTLPWQRWLRGPLGLQVALRLGGLTPSLGELLNRKAVQSTWQSFLLESTGWARPWSLFVLNEWVRRHVDEAQTPAQVEQECSVGVAAPGAMAS